MVVMAPTAGAATAANPTASLARVLLMFWSPVAARTHGRLGDHLSKPNKINDDPRK